MSTIATVDRTTTPAESVGSFMTRNVVTLERNQTLELADQLMTFERIRHLPVVDDGRVVGVVSERDLLRVALGEALGYGNHARHALLRSLTVKEVMSEPAVTIDPRMPARDAARLMLNGRIGCLPVVQDGVLVGLVTEGDLLRRAYAA